MCRVVFEASNRNHVWLLKAPKWWWALYETELQAANTRTALP